MSASARRPIHGANAKARTHEMAQLRAQRAARRSREQASGKRRMAAAGSFTALTLVATLAVVFSETMSWLWILAPLLGLGTVLVSSRLAAVRSTRADAADRERLATLRGKARIHSPHQNAEALIEERPAVSVYTTPTPEGQLVHDSTRVSVSQPAPSVHAVETVGSPDEIAAALPLPESSIGSSPATANPNAEDNLSEDSLVVPADVTVSTVDEEPEILPAKTQPWTPRKLPISRYSQGSRVQGKVVHADTDLRGIPRVEAAIPARPVAPTTDPNAQSTEAVAASVPLAFDLDDVLEARRA